MVLLGTTTTSSIVVAFTPSIKSLGIQHQQQQVGTKLSMTEQDENTDGVLNKWSR
jgi:hypothetical protein